MTQLQTIKTGVCLAALFSGQAALADVTAAEVWESWKSNLDIYGEDGVTIGSEDIGGGTVTITDLSMAMDDGDTAVAGTIGNITFTENGDGTVAITMSDTLPITVTSSDGSSVDMSVTSTDLAITASGDPDAVSYEVSAEKYSFVVDNITEAGQTTDVEIVMTANDVAGEYLITAGDVRNFKYALTMASVDVLIDGKDPSTDSVVLVSGKINGLYVDADMDLPEGLSFEDPENMDLTNFAINAKYGLSDGAYIFDVTDGADNFAGSASTGSADVDISFDSQAVSYNVLTKDIAVDTVVPDVPIPGMELPLALSLGEYGINVAFPLAKTEEPTDFALGLNLTDLTINDDIWAMGDPAGALPRDPITMQIDLTGTAKLFFDLLDPEQADAIAMADVPGELHSLSLNNLLVTAVGATLDGTGAFTFDNTDLTTIPDIPRPEGEVTLNLAGANKLIDTLIQMGLVPEDQAMGARMMMGMFARNVGDDQLTTTVEVNAEGHVIANGQRIR